ncbi:hypothetical protein [Pseudomonas citronellolis]|uniref:hypothetical protein n=1 Tax=Pseudomonas citronellolis TaxID=53408 RepID=UPI0021BF8C7C|nr:hypothetical protein [Pseudomonas citronellolis]UXJ50301.1 hypothetical protein N5P21_20160 [Pseudomonas citronellolis]
MKRIPYTSRDLDKLRDISRRLFNNVESISSSDHNKLNELIASISGYNDYHDLRTEAAKCTLPPSGFLSRSEIQLRFALGLRQLTGMSLVPAFRQAGQAKLRILSLDEQTAERAQEESLKQRVTNSSHKALESLSSAKRRDLRNQLVAAGAPRFKLIVRRDGIAFHWEPCLSLYEAICRSKDFCLLEEPELSGCQSEDEALARFVRETLIPSAWRPVIDLMRDGLEVPYHRVISLFDDEGEYIGRAIQHTVHSGIVPCLFYTDDEVLMGLADLLSGRPNLRGSARTALIGPILGDAPVFTLKSGAKGPKSVIELYEQHHVSVDQLESIYGLKGGAMSMSTGRGVTRVWEINGDTMCYTEEDFGNWSIKYVETLPWLTEQDFPYLYPHYIAPEQPQRRDFWVQFDRKLVLSKDNADLQERAEKLLRRHVNEALARLENASASGELLERILRHADTASMEVRAEVHFHADYLVDPEITDSESERARHQADRDEKKLEHIRLLDTIAESLVARMPELLPFGKYSLWFATTAIFALLDDVDVGDVALYEILSQLALLAGVTEAGATFEYYRDDMVDIAVAQWLDNQFALDQLPSVASEFYGYHVKLSRQRTRLQKVADYIADELDRREHARELGYAYVSEYNSDSKLFPTNARQAEMFRRIHRGRMF